MNARSAWLVGFVLAVSAGFIALLTHWTPLAGDDLCVANWGAGNYGPFVKDYYLGWGGRVVAHTFVFFFANMPKEIFDVANGLAFAALVWLGSKLVLGPEKPVLWWVPALLAMLYFTQIPIFGEAVIWLSGSGNYLWTMLLVFLFLLPYRWLVGGKDWLAARGPWAAVAFGFFAILSGWTNENTGAAAWGVALLMMLDGIWQQRRFALVWPPLWTLCGLAGQLVGVILLVVAPGNAIRLAAPTVQAAAATPATERIGNYMEHVQDYLFTPWPMVFVFFVFGVILLRRGLVWTLLTNNAARLIIIWGLGASACLGLLLLGPYVEQRALTSAWIFLALGATACVFELRTVYPGFMKLWVLLIAILTAFTAAGVLGSYWQLNRDRGLIAAEIEACREDGRAVCLLTPYSVEADRYQFISRIAQIKTEADDVYNVCMAKHTGLPAVRARYATVPPAHP